MRRLGLGLLLTLTLALVVLGPAGAPADAGTRHQCRMQWSDLVSLHGENGNPEGPVPELTARWDAMFQGAEVYAESGTAHDCGGVIADYADRWGDLEGFMYDLHPYDALGRLGIAEGDRHHFLQFNHVRHLSKRLEHQFRIARREAPLAAAEFAPVLATTPGLDLSDAAAVKATLYQLKRVARHSEHEDRLDRALRVIGDAELDEE